MVRAGFRLVVLVVSCLAALPLAAGSELTEAEQRGKTIYLKGTNAAGDEIVALMGEAGLEVPAASLPCANCHGRDGRGVPEGGVSPSNLTWAALTTPYGVRHETGREHPPYEDRTLLRAVTMGIDPGGNDLHLAMPRYRLTREDAADLMAYLKRLGSEPEPGLTEEGLTIATLVPVGESSAGDGLASLALMRAYFDDLNARGGIYGRKVTLEVLRIEAGADKLPSRATLEDFFEEKKPFAVLYPYMAGIEEELIAISERRELPMVAPVTLRPKTGFPVDRYLFYLLPGPVQEARALVTDLVDSSAGDELAWAIVAPDDATGPVSDALEAIDREIRQRELVEPQRVSFGVGASFDPEKVAESLRKTGAQRIVFTTNPEDSKALFEHFLTLDWQPDLFLPVSLVGKGLAALQSKDRAYGGRVYVALPGLPGMAGVDGSKIDRIRQMYENHGIPPSHPAAQRALIAAADLLVEGLRRAGRGVTREDLVDQFEDLYEYETGYVPALTFGPNRRIGALGAYVLVLEPEQGDEGKLRWVDLDPT